MSWTPDFSWSGQRPPEWTEVRCHGERLTNALNWVQWDDAPVQVVLHQYTASEVVIRHGAVVIPVATWESWRRRFANLPPADALPPAQERDLRAAWY